MDQILAYHGPHDPCLVVPVPDLGPSRDHGGAVTAVHARARAPIAAVGAVPQVPKGD